VIGESYGATRAAGLAEHLQEELGMDLNGLMLVSPALSFQTLSFDSGNDLPYLLFLPAYAATAWYHRLLPEELQSLELPLLLERARSFAYGPFAQALLQGDALPAKERQGVAAEAATLTGLSPELLARARLRLPVSRFTAELLREQGRMVGRFDSRITGIAEDPAAHAATYDPSYAAVHGVFSAALKDYVREELGFESDLPYEIIAKEVRPWDWGKYENRYLDMGERLFRALTRRPRLRLFVAAGYYDLATSLASVEYTLDHLGLDPSLRGNLLLARYETGHMPYLHEPSLARLRQDLVRFLGAGSP
jgi:carboxypeptidase C (cathepsin A)